MNPVSAASEKLQWLRSQLAHHDPGLQVSMSEGAVVIGVSLRSNRQPDQQHLRTYLHGLSRELAACLDDFLQVSESRTSMDLVANLGDGPVTVDKLTNVLDAALLRLQSMASAEPVLHQITHPSLEKLRALGHEVDSAWREKQKGLGSLDDHEVLAAPPDEWTSHDLKVKSKPHTLSLTSAERLAKRRGLQQYVANLANRIGHEVLLNQPNRNDPLHEGLLDALRDLAHLGSDGRPVSPEEFIAASQTVLAHAEKSADKSRLFNVYKDRLVKNPAIGFKCVQQTPLFRVLFETTRAGDHPLIDGLTKRLPDLKNHLKKERVQESISRHGVTPEEVLAVWAYSVMSRPLNESCRANAPVEGAQAIVDNLVLALAKLRPPTTNILFRGVNPAHMAPAQIQQLTTVGSIFIDAAPLSTSYDPDRAFGDALKITIRPCESSQGRSILPLSESPQEKEVLFPPYTRFLVAEVVPNFAGEVTAVTLLELAQK